MEGDRQAVPPLSFGTKAETLARLRGRLTCADVLPQAVVTVGDWRAGPDKFLEALRGEDWGAGPLIARSSALGEEDGEASLAGHYLTIPNVTGDEALAAAIDDVIVSYVPANDGHQVLVQPMLQETAASGVAFGCDPNTGGPYLVVEYEPGPAGPAAITGGTTGRSRVFFRHRAAGATGEEFLDRIGAMMDELSVLFGTPRLDVEFAIEPDSRLLVLQVRPLHGAADPLVGLEDHARAVADVADKITSMARPHPHLLGGKGVFGIMPDWNPAEIIGVRPRGPAGWRSVERSTRAPCRSRAGCSRVASSRST